MIHVCKEPHTNYAKRTLQIERDSTGLSISTDVRAKKSDTAFDGTKGCEWGEYHT